MSEPLSGEFPCFAGKLQGSRSDFAKKVARRPVRAPSWRRPFVQRRARGCVREQGIIRGWDGVLLPKEPTRDLLRGGATLCTGWVAGGQADPTSGVRGSRTVQSALGAVPVRQSPIDSSSMDACFHAGVEKNRPERAPLRGHRGVGTVPAPPGTSATEVA